jgi:4-amino-4-deoxy-L-arabinose transferase-like glycosyltransferase
MSEATSTLPRAVWLAAGLGLALRLAFGLGYWVDQPLTRDEVEYLSLARSVAAGRGLVPDLAGGPVDPFGRAPGYPLFLALVGGGRAPTVGVPASVTVAQSAVAAFGILIIGLLARRFAGPRAAVAASVIAACYPPLVWTSARVFSEALFWPLGLGVAWLFGRAMSRTRPAPAALLACGIACGIAILVRPGFLLFLPVAILWLLARRHAAAAVVLGLGAALTIAPWTVRNYRHYGRFVLVASEGGITFWTGNHPLATGEGDLAANPRLKVASQRLRAEHPDLTEEQMEPIYYREAFAWMRAEPLAWLVLEMKKLFYLVVPIGPSYRLHSARYYLASVISFAVLLPIAVLGLARGARELGATPGLWLTAGAAVVTCLIFFPQERFRTPSIDPALIVAAGAYWRRNSS